MSDLIEWQGGMAGAANEMVLAFTNYEADRLNRIIRYNLGRGDEYEVGDRLVFAKPLYRENQRVFEHAYPLWLLGITGPENSALVHVHDTTGECNPLTQYLKSEKKHCVPIAQLKYGYAMTIHRSQGSQWERVFVNFENIKRCGNIEDRRRLFYVAISRATHDLSVYVKES